MDPLKMLVSEFKKIQNPTHEDRKQFNNVFAATLASLEAAKKTAGPPVRDDDVVLASVMAESKKAFDKEQEDIKRAMTNSLHGSGWGGGWQLGGAQHYSLDAALARQSMNERRGRPSSKPPAAAQASSKPPAAAQEDADLREALEESAELQAAVALSLTEGKQRMSEEDREKLELKHQGMVFCIIDFNRAYNNQRARVLRYSVTEDLYFVELINPVAGFDGAEASSRFWLEEHQISPI
jgi:hypothetical protein